MPVGEDDWEDAVVAPPVDFADVSADPQGHPSSLAPEMDPHQAAAGTESEATEPEPLPEFDPKVREDFEGLLYLGRLVDTFYWMGHSFKIKTLTAGEIMEIALIHKPYLGTLADTKAYQAAVVAACVLEVDGRPMPIPVTNRAEDTVLITRFEYVMRSWFSPTLDVVYDKYLVLETRVDEVIAAMGKAHGWTDTTPTSNVISA